MTFPFDMVPRSCCCLLSLFMRSFMSTLISAKSPYLSKKRLESQTV